MFLEYYGLREQPFGVTPDPRYLYFSGMHREALSSLFYGIETGCAFLTLIAPPGLGKTTLLLHLLERLRRSTRTVFLFQTQCDSREFFRYLLTDLGVDASNQNMAQMHEALNSVLLSNARMGRRLVLIIDEAQNLKKSVLETVRLLSDFETPAAKLMQIVLSGQLQLAERLSHPDLMQLRQRISIASRLHPFTRVEMMLYIHHRLNVAGYSGAPLFNCDAIDQIVAHSGGVPRNINNICFNALTLGYAKRQKQITGSIVSEVLADLDIDALRSHRAAPAFATQDSPSSVDGLEPTDEATFQDFHFAASAFRVKGVEGSAREGHAESAPIPMAPGGDSNPPAVVSQKDSSELAVAESPLQQKDASAEEIVSLGFLQAPLAGARVPPMPDGAEMLVEKARNGEDQSPKPAAVLAAVAGSSVQPSRSELNKPHSEDQTPTPESLAQPTVIVAGPTLTSADPSFVSDSSRERVQAVAHDSPLAPDIPTIEIPEQSSIPTLSFTEASQATFGPRANTATLSSACPTTREAFDCQLKSGIDAHKAQDSGRRKHWKLIASCGAVLFVAGVGGVPFFHHESVGDGVVASTLAPAAQAIPTSKPVAHVDRASKNFKTASTNPPKETIPSARGQQSATSVTSDMFAALNAHPVSTRHAAATQAATASSADAGFVFSDENSNARLGITASSDYVAPPSPTYNSDRLLSIAEQVKQPELLSRIPPHYPPLARRHRVEGDVVVNFVVEESGNVSDLNIVSGPVMLRQAAISALRTSKYKPAQLDGQTTAMNMQVTFSFHLP